MENNKSLNTLNQMFKNQSWFHSVGLDEFNRPTVYAKFISPEIEKSVPRELDGKQVMLHFSATKTLTRDSFVNDKTKIQFSDSSLEIEDLSILELQNKLDELSDLYSFSDIKDVFWEVHDGINAVTSVAKMFPSLKNELQKLYDEFGFDVLYTQYFD